MKKRLSKYAIKFDKSCKLWRDDLISNLKTLEHLRIQFNEILNSRGYVFYRDILEYLGIPITKESCLIGWTYDLSEFDYNNGIVFEIYQTGSPDLYVDFNIDGHVILDDIVRAETQR